MPSTLGIVSSGYNTPAPVVSDAFNRADSTTTMGNADSGQTWVPNRGTWGISSNRAYCVNSAVGQCSTVIDSGLADCSVQMTVQTTGDVGMCWRSTDDNNHFLGGSGSIYRKQGGGYTLVASGSAVSSGDVIKVVLSGSSHTLTKNGAAWCSFTDSFNSTATKHGIRHHNSTSFFDDFTVTA